MCRYALFLLARSILLIYYLIYSCMSINSYGLKINTTKIADYIYKTIKLIQLISHCYNILGVSAVYMPRCDLDT